MMVWSLIAADELDPAKQEDEPAAVFPPPAVGTLCRSGGFQLFWTRAILF
jgi:hypothetical protein